MEQTPKSNRLHVAIFGRTNVGKSSLLNMMMGQEIAITSNVPGTTTDVVEKAMELLPLGAVLFLDTAGIDDYSELAAQRIDKTMRIFERADIILLVVEAGSWGNHEENILLQAQAHSIPTIILVNKIDLVAPDTGFLQLLKTKSAHVMVVSTLDTTMRDKYVDGIKRMLIQLAPDNFLQPPSIVGDFLTPGGIAVLVVPIDLQAPKGRLILPQVQTIRDALDNDAAVVVVKERELSSLLSSLRKQPDIVICDSQAILKVVADVPAGILCTTFSILFARLKGNLELAAAGAAHIETLKSGDKILIAEACSHHPLQDDIGRVKIPRWLRQYVGADLQVDVSVGRDYPENISEYRLIIHCGACMLTRREMLGRIQKARENNVPITNYGLAISFTQGVMERVLCPFPHAREMFIHESESIKNMKKEQ